MVVYVCKPMSICFQMCGHSYGQPMIAAKKYFLLGFFESVSLIDLKFSMQAKLAGWQANPRDMSIFIFLEF